MEFSREQKKAIDFGNGNLRLLAGAGSGKTAVLTERASRLIKSGVSPERILCITFTNKAAEEMSTRVQDKTHINKSDLRIMTFHRFALNIVEEELKAVFPTFDGELTVLNKPIGAVIADYARGTELEDILKKDSYNLDAVSTAYARMRRTPQYMGYWENPLELPSMAEIEDAITEYANNKRAYNSARGKIGRTDDPVKIQKALDEFATYGVSAKSEEVMNALVSNIQYSQRGVLGFDDIIYGAIYLLNSSEEVRNKWREMFDYIQVDEFQDMDEKQLELIMAVSSGNLFVVGDPDQSIYQFRGANPSIFVELDKYIPDLETYYLSNNYRSNTDIIDASNKVITLNKNRIKKTTTGEGTGVVEYMYGSDLAKQEFDKIQALLLSGVSHNDIAVLYRSKTDGVVVDLQNMLKAADIPVDSTLNDKDNNYMFAFYLACYRYSHDDSMLYMAADASGMGYCDIEEFRGFADSADTDAMWGYVTKPKEAYKKDGSPMKSYQTWLSREQEIKNKFSQAYEDFDNAPNKDLLCMTGLESTEDSEGDGIKIYTIHKSKGLEFDYVFCNSLTNKSMSGVADTYKLIEEHVRLAYVGYSRAIKELYLCCANKEDEHGVFGIVDGNIDAVQSYYDKLDESANKHILYVPLVIGDEKVAYRCEMYYNGERVGFQADINDLKKYNCVPVYKDFLVKIGKRLEVLTKSGSHYLCLDEYNKLIRVLDLNTEEEIRAIFGGSNNGCNKDIKDMEVVSELASRAKYTDKEGLEVVKNTAAAFRSIL